MKELPEDAMAFAMAHELKHLLDSDLEMEIRFANPLGIGADVFAAELIYPEKAFESDLERMRTRAGESHPTREQRELLPPRSLGGIPFGSC